MGIVSIAITECEYDVATLRVLRAYSNESMSTLRAKLGTHEPAIHLTTHEDPQFDVMAGLRMRHAVILEACDKLIATGAKLEVSFAALGGDHVPAFDVAQLPAVFADEIESYRRANDELARAEAEEAALED